jgi:hypothetical protein
LQSPQAGECSKESRARARLFGCIRSSAEFGLSDRRFLIQPVVAMQTFQQELGD